MQDFGMKVLNMRSKKIYACFLYLLAGLYLSGCIAVTPKEDPVKKDMNSLRQEITAQQQRLAHLEEAVKKGTAGIKQEVRSQKSEVRRIDEYGQKERAGINASIDRVREDMAFLSGRLGEIESGIRKIGEDLGTLREKTADKKELEGRLNSMQGQLAGLEGRLASLSEKVAALEQMKSPPAAKEASIEPDKQETRPQKPDELYDEAIRFVKEKEYSNAIEKFTRFLSVFPGHDRAANAQYWVGEIYYAQKDYERAVLEFNEVVKKYPKSAKVPAALLKQGMAFNELGNKKEAKLIMERIIDKYPKADEAGRAKKILKGMK